MDKASKKILETIKKAIKDTPTPLAKPTTRERDMRKEAMDMGSHGAAEFFKDPQ